MRHFPVAVCLLLVVVVSPALAKTKKVHGYVTQVNSPTSFEIDDFKVTRELSLVLDLEKDEDEINGPEFKPEDIRVGTEVEIKGEYNESSGELKAQSIKVFLTDAKKVKRTALIGRLPKLSQMDDQWSGTILADGERIRVTPQTAVTFQPNKSEKKAIKQKEKAKKAPPSDSNEEPQVEKLTSLAQIEINTFIKYEGVIQPDGSIAASKVTFMRNELESGEAKFWKETTFQQKEPDYLSLKPGELKIKSIGKYKLVPNKEVQAYVSALGEKLIPEYQRALPASDPNKIPFKFFVVEAKVPNAFATSNGIVVVHSGIVEALENEAQLAAVLGHEIAHSIQEHPWRQHEYHKKSLTALKIGSAFAAGMGYGGISNIANMVEGAIRSGYSRSLENQSDRLGLEYMASAGYDPREAPRVWKVMSLKFGNEPTNFFWSSHDSNDARRSYLMAELRNNYTDFDFASVKKSETEYEEIVRKLRESVNKKNRLKVKY